MPPVDPKSARGDEASGAFELFWVENIAVVAWLTDATASSAVALYSSVEEQCKQYPKGVSLVHVARAQSSTMDPQVRDAFVRGLKDLRGSLVAIAVVAPANGFWASALRSLVTGVLVLSRASFEVRFHERVEDVLQWLPDRHKELTGVAIERERLQSALGKAHALVSAQASRG